MFHIEERRYWIEISVMLIDDIQLKNVIKTILKCTGWYFSVCLQCDSPYIEAGLLQDTRGQTEVSAD